MPAADPQGTAVSRRIAWLAGAGFALVVFALGALGWLVVDVDADGCASYDELRTGTHPMNGDTDGDGIADGWELDHGLDPTDPTSRIDPASLDPQGPGGGPSEECSDLDRLAGLCDPSDSPGSGTDADPASDAPPSGKDGSTTTFVLGGVVSLVAGVGARIVSQVILHK